MASDRCTVSKYNQRYVDTIAIMQYGRHAIGEVLPCKMELSNPEDRFAAEAGTIIENAGPLE